MYLENKSAESDTYPTIEQSECHKNTGFDKILFFFQNYHNRGQSTEEKEIKEEREKPEQE